MKAIQLKNKLGTAPQAESHWETSALQQDVELALLCPSLEKLQLIPVIGADLVAGYASLLLLVHDDPAHLLGKIPAGFALHGDVRLVQFIVVDLLGR